MEGETECPLYTFKRSQVYKGKSDSLGTNFRTKPRDKISEENLGTRTNTCY